MTIVGKIYYLLSKPFTRRKREIQMLMDHPIFRDISSWVNIKVRALDIQCPSKREMATAYLTIYFEEMQQFYTNLCDHYDEYTVCSRTMYKSLHNVIGIVNERATAVYVPKMFLDKMDVRFLKHIDILSQTIASSMSKKSYSTEFEQVSSILDMSLLFLHMEVDAIEDTINSMNGELEKVLQGTIYDRDH